MLRMGIIGSGMVFQAAHAPVYEARDDVEVTAVADPSELNRKAACERFHCDGFADFRQLLERADVDAVDVCVPHSLHEEVVLAAFDAGKDVVLEKPIAINLEQADRMLAAARNKGRGFHVLLNQRMFPPHRTIKHLIGSGEYGPPYLAVGHIFGDELSRMNDLAHWKGTWEHSGGGALADSGTHIVDLMLWWFGRPETVSCQWGRFAVEAESKADDNVAVTLGYGHMLADIVVSYSTQCEPWRESKWVYMRDGALHCHMDPDTPLLLGQGGQAPAPFPTSTIPSWWDGSVKAVLEHFVDCLQGKAEPDFRPDAARDALEIILLAYKAAEEGRTQTVPPRNTC